MKRERGTPNQTAAAPDWEAAILEESLSRRSRAAGGFYWAASPSAVPPGVVPIALTGGIPDPDSLPFVDLAEASRTVLEREGSDALRYGGAQGFQGLREWLADRLGRQDGVTLGPENFTLSNGSAGALANICETFLDPGDTVIVEAPSFPGAARAMRSLQVEMVQVPLDDEGLRPDLLADALERLDREGRRPKLLYTIPNFHNPTGTTLPLERRRDILELARHHRTLIVEDDAYVDIRFEGDRVPSFFSLAGGEGVLRVGTFSKTIATGLRVGWVQATQGIVDALVGMRFDAGQTPWVQRVVAEYASTGKLDRHVPVVVDVYRRKRDAMLAALDERCSSLARWRAPEGGFFLWLKLAERVDPAALEPASLEEGVIYVPGPAFFEDRSGAEYIRLAYSFVAERDIAEAIRRLGRALERAAR
jgi:2-aminoadipate transaminase